MNLEWANFQASALGSTVLLWIASTVWVFVCLKRDIPTSTRSLIAIFLGPFALLALLIRRQQDQSRFRKTKIAFSVLSAALLIVLPTMFAFWFLRFYLGIVGEPLQWPLLVTLLVFGFIAGVYLSVKTLSVAFKEGLLVAWLVSLLPVIFSKHSFAISTYGTSLAYFSALLLTSYLLLLLMLTLGGSLGFLFFGEGRLSLDWRFETWVGQRFLQTKRRTQAISMITVISVTAVMIGCAGMIIVMSVMNGFSTDLREKILGSNAHLMLLKYGNDYSEYADVIQSTKTLPGVTGCSPFILNEVMISSESNLSGAIIKGVDPKTVAEVSQLQKNMVKGSLKHLENPEQIKTLNHVKDKGQQASSEIDMLERVLESTKDEKPNTLPGIVIGNEMAKALHVFVGDVVNVVSPVGELGPAGPIPKASAFRVAGIFFSGMYEYDAKFTYIELKQAQHFFSQKNSVTGIEYQVLDIEDVQSVSKELLNSLGGYPYHTKDWMQMNRNLFSALKLEKIAMFIILMALIFMASLLILVALTMVVMEKGKEIAILKSMGATDVSIMKIFVTYGLSIGGLGSALGLILGLGLCFVIQSLGIGLDPEVYYISKIPIKIDMLELTAVISGAVIVSFLATIPPALFASSLKPVEGLRYE